MKKESLFVAARRLRIQTTTIATAKIVLRHKKVIYAGYEG
jgi:hypothetical protein